MIESVQFTKGSGDLISGRKSNKTINELQNEVNALRESNKLLKKFLSIAKRSEPKLSLPA